MYIYIWTSGGVPFYVGLTKNMRRTNPRNNGGRNWLCKQRLLVLGVDSVHVEIQRIDDMLEARKKECALISQYGRIDLGTGTLTNLRSGGEGTHIPTAEHREKLRQIMLDPAHPIRSAESLARRKQRMNDADVKERFVGDKNPAKRPEVRAKIRAAWADPAFREAQRLKHTGVPKNFSVADLAARAAAVVANPEMKTWGERNGKDPVFDAKRIAGIQAAQPRRAEKMRDPVALAQRKERLKATMASPEYKAKRAAFDTPEYREKLSAAKREYWAKKKAAIP